MHSLVLDVSARWLSSLGVSSLWVDFLMCVIQFVSLRDKEVPGSSAIVSATLDEVRIWSVEGQRIGQFGHDRWDLSVGINHSFDEDADASSPDDDEEGEWRGWSPLTSLHSVSYCDCSCT